MLQARRSRIRVSVKSLDSLFDLPNPSSPNVSLEFNQPLTEMITRSIKIMFLGSKAAAGA
jgi:hypothetical protein